MKTRLTAALSITVFLTASGIYGFTAWAQETPKITKEELKGMFGNPDLIIIDVRSGMDWDNSKLKIKGALRENPREVKSWISRYSKDKTLVFYCA